MPEGCLTKGGLFDRRQRLPVTVITGFRGSGKTTLLNHILNNVQGLKVAVLVNEFTDIELSVNINVAQHTDDQQSIAGEPSISGEQAVLKEQMVELSNGCLCCTINESLVDTVYQVLAHISDRISDRKEQIDYLVVEADGLADPLPIMRAFADAELKALTWLDAVVGVVDAEAFGPALLKNPVYANQLVYSDVILLNKTDLVSAEQVTTIEQDIHLLKSGARLLSGSLSDANFPLSAIFWAGLGYADGNFEPESELDSKRYALSARELSERLVSDNFVSIPFRSDRPFNFTKFEHFLTQQLPDTLFRAKGILWFEEQPQRYLFQLAGQRYDLSPAPTAGTVSDTAADTFRDVQVPPRQNQLVFIGHRLNPLQINQQLINCLSH